MLKSIFVSAGLQVSFDSSGNVLVKNNNLPYLVIPKKDQRRIWLVSVYNFKPTVTQIQTYELANNIKSYYIMVRAIVVNNTIQLTYDIILDGGMTPQSIVACVNRFCSIAPQTVVKFGSELLE
jgi:hydroxyacyl-ACP dehydratase HTD2-like protein with hotdog domain